METRSGGATESDESIVDSGLELNDEGEDHDVEGDARGGGENRQRGEESLRLGAQIFVKHLSQRADDGNLEQKAL